MSINQENTIIIIVANREYLSLMNYDYVNLVCEVSIIAIESTGIENKAK